MSSVNENYFLNLPPELSLCVFDKLPAKDIGVISQVSKIWNELANTDAIWINLLHRDFPFLSQERLEEENLRNHISYKKIHERQQMRKKFNIQDHEQNEQRVNTLPQQREYRVEDLIQLIESYEQRKVDENELIELHKLPEQNLKQTIELYERRISEFQQHRLEDHVWPDIKKVIHEELQPLKTRVDILILHRDR